MLSTESHKVGAGVLGLANTLAVERYGKRLHDLDERYQRDLIVDAKGMLAHYLEQ